MGFLNDVLASDAAAFADPDFGFGEPVVYTKRGGVTRTINAVVYRTPPVTYDQGVKSPALQIDVANSATTGISTAEIDYGSDTITVAQRIGGAAKAFQIHQPADGQSDQDAGMLRIELR
jgi:hypothetical protein